ncbi:NAD(P)-binding protein [Poronia punctata]|nr:NAD(P)-binding protein [Poronia punctata]
MPFNLDADIPDLEGKVILVTGGNTGLGAATIKALARHNPSRIYLCARPVSVSQGEALAKDLEKNIDIRVRPLDLSSLTSVKKFAADFLQEEDRLDTLILNAGISSTAPAVTEEGYERQFGVNYLGHALLVQLLMPMLLRTASSVGSDVRVLVTSSLAAYLAPPENGLALGDMKRPDPLASPYQRYAHSKLACILFARKLAERYPGIKCVSFNPGQVRTDLFKKASGINYWVLMTLGMAIMYLTGVSVGTGALNGLWAASTSADGLLNGAYYEPVGVVEDKKKFLTDDGLADELWEWTEKELESHGGPGWPTT